MKIFRDFLVIAVIAALMVLMVILMMPNHNFVGVDGYRYHPSPSPCQEYIDNQLEQIGCSFEEEFLRGN